MLRFKTSAIAMAAVVAAGLTFSAATAKAQEAVRIGTSSVGSIFYTIAIGASEIIRKHSGLSTTVQPVGGSGANVNGLGAKKIEFALANAYASSIGYMGTGAFKGKPVPVRLVFQGQPSYRFLFARKGTGIKTPKDLEGKIVIAERKALPELKLLMNAYAKVFGLDMSKVKVVATVNTGEVIKALRSRSVDAAILPFSRKAPHVDKPLNDGIIEWVVISKEKRDAMLKMMPAAMHAGHFAPKVFSNQPEDIYLFEMNTYFITRADVSDDTVYKVAKAVLDNNKEFVTYHKAAATWTAKRSVQNFAVPFHPGAVRYYKEKGLWSDAVAASQKALSK